jgi:SAM-dependent methyltransferase
MKRVNVGCGMTPTQGWINFDNSLSVKLSLFPGICKLFYLFNVINSPSVDFIKFAQKNKIYWADVTKKIPLPDNSVEVLYSSHMLEHLDRSEVKVFLKEAKRVLVIGGIIRILVPDIAKLVKKYHESRDADLFIESTHLCISRPRKLTERIRFLLIGTRQHQWMYDSNSLCNVLHYCGFGDPKSLKPGHSRILNPEPLDLYEREDESLYVEAIKL